VNGIDGPDKRTAHGAEWVCFSNSREPQLLIMILTKRAEIAGTTIPRMDKRTLGSWTWNKAHDRAIYKVPIFIPRVVTAPSLELL
jgi:hypothetical protein